MSDTSSLRGSSSRNPASTAKKKQQWQMPFQPFRGASQLEVITVIANCGVRTELATEAIFKYIRAKQEKGRTHYEILSKLELMENKFLAFTVLHDSFRVARHATGLPPSRILPARPGGRAKLESLPEEPAPPQDEAVAGSSKDHQRPVAQEVQSIAEPAQPRSDHVEHADDDAPKPPDALDFVTKPPPPLRLLTLLETRRARMARRHSIHGSSPVSSPAEEDNSSPDSPRRNPLSLSHIRRRSSIGSYAPSSNRASTSTSCHPAWPAPAVAFDPEPQAPALTDSDFSPSDWASTSDMQTQTSRPTTSADSYYPAPTRTPSVTSFRVLDSVRQSVQAKFDPEMAESLFYGSKAKHFLRIFRAEED